MAFAVEGVDAACQQLEEMGPTIFFYLWLTVSISG
jgi:hypothetical protein